MSGIDRYLRRRHGIRKPERATLEDIFWRTLMVVAGIFMLAFAGHQIADKYDKPPPASHMTKTLKVNK